MLKIQILMVSSLSAISQEKAWPLGLIPSFLGWEAGMLEALGHSSSLSGLSIAGFYCFPFAHQGNS